MNVALVTSKIRKSCPSLMDARTKSSSKKKSRHSNAASLVGSSAGSTTNLSSSRVNSGADYSSLRRSGLLQSFNRSLVGSKSSLYSSSRKSLTSDSQKFQKPQAQILDENGEDVTPRSLLQQDHSLKRHQSNMFGEGADAHYSVYGGTTITSLTQPFSKSVFGTSVEGTNVSLQGSISEEIMKSPTMHSEQHTPREDTLLDDYLEETKALTDADLEKEVFITLCETDTFWLLDILGTCVAPESDEATDVRMKNQQYKELVKSRPGNDRYSERSMQTINDALKTKHMQTDAVLTMDTGMYASMWDMYDTYEALEHTPEDEEEMTIEQLSSKATSERTSRAVSRAPTGMGFTSVLGDAASTHMGTSMFMSSAGPSDVIPAAQGETAELKPAIDPTQPNDHPILKSESLIDKMCMMERAITLNYFQQKQALYRNLTVLVDPDIPAPSVSNLNIHAPHLEKLWVYSCSITKRRNVTCLAWNPSNKDIIAAGYGNFSANKQDQGLICCWSLKNPEHPERILSAMSGVTSLSFSTVHPNLLAAGLFNGNVAVYNIRSKERHHVLDSRDALYKHSAPVWQVTWVVKEHMMGENKTENLVSISVDGRILQWSIRKGFESTQLMKLKRMEQPKKPTQKKSPTKSRRKSQGHTVQASSSQGEAYISQHAPGMGFDFSSKDSNIYLVCTEEGYIYKCSCSYNEQFLETYTGHTGPVYRVKWSPFVSDMFLSCSADWTVRLWHQEHMTPIYTFHAAQKSIYDICWSPFDSTLFGCVSDGRVEIWSLQHSVLDHLLLYKPLSGAKQTCIQFAHNAKVVLVGDSNGEVAVYLLRNIPEPPQKQGEALLNIVRTASSKPTYT